jgi:hypothetical protein
MQSNLGQVCDVFQQPPVDPRFFKTGVSKKNENFFHAAIPRLPKSFLTKKVPEKGGSLLYHTGGNDSKKACTQKINGIGSWCVGKIINVFRHTLVMSAPL